MSIRYFPFDVQDCTLVFASRDDPIDYLKDNPQKYIVFLFNIYKNYKFFEVKKIDLTRWNVQNNIVADRQHVHYNETNINVFKSGFKKGQKFHYCQDVEKQEGCDVVALMRLTEPRVSLE